MLILEIALAAYCLYLLGYILYRLGQEQEFPPVHPHRRLFGKVFWLAVTLAALSSLVLK